MKSQSLEVVQPVAVIFKLFPLQISDSFKKFGIKDTSQSMLAVLLHDAKECSEVCYKLQFNCHLD